MLTSSFMIQQHPYGPPLTTTPNITTTSLQPSTDTLISSQTKTSMSPRPSTTSTTTTLNTLGLPSFHTLFGTYHANNSPYERYLPNPNNTTTNSTNPKETSSTTNTSSEFLLPPWYNPLHYSTTNQFSAFGKEGVPVPGHHRDNSVGNVLRFPLSDRVSSISNSDIGTGRFILLEQPNEIQRKSYKNESR
jgi:hypothetical protein